MAVSYVAISQPPLLAQAMAFGLLQIQHDPIRGLITGALQTVCLQIKLAAEPLPIATVFEDIAKG